MNKKTYTVAMFLALSAISVYSPVSYAGDIQQISVSSITRDSELYEHLLDIIADYCNCDKSEITMSTELSTLGIDSLGRLELGSIIYFKLDVELSFEELSEAATVADLYDRILFHKS